MCRIMLLLAVVSGAMSNGVARAADPGATAHSAAEKVRAAIDAESRIYEVTSLRVASTTDTKLTPRYVQQLKDAGGNPQPNSRERTEFVFDERRARQTYEIEGGMSFTEVWDGAERTLHRSAQAGETETYTLTNSFINGFSGNLPWMHFGARRFWWTPLEQTNRNVARPEKFTLLGEENFQGARCFRCQSVALLCRLYIGVDDGLLHGMVQFQLPTEAEELTMLNRLVGKQFKSIDEVNGYFATLSADEQSRLEAEHDRKRFAGPRPYYEMRLQEYREIAPGLRIPFQITYLRFEADGKETFATRESHTRISVAEVNPPLADDAFLVAIPPGARVEDGRDGLWPPLAYPFQNEFSSEQWKAITAPRKQDLAKVRQNQAKRTARLGQTPPDFGAGTWRNSEKLAQPDLRGKLVLLEFMADWCGACKRHYPTVAYFHDQRDRTGMFVIGVHTAGSDAPAVEEFIKQTGIVYPVYEDAPGKRGSMGELCEWFQFDGVPQSVLLDRDGKVAAVGALEDVLLKARNLAAPPASK